MKRVWMVLASLALLTLPGCDSNAEKIAAFCSDWQQVVESNKGDCDAMGIALQDLVKSYDGTKLYGTADDPESQEAVATCREAATTMLIECPNNAEVEEAIELFESP